MAKCPDCYSARLTLEGERGDGKCYVCQGSGKEQGLEGIISDLTGLRGGECYECRGTGRCRTCNGTGEV